MTDEQLKELIETLHRDGVSITDTIRALYNEHNVPLDVIKQAVFSHPAWRAVARAQEPLHDDLVRIIEEIGEPGPDHDAE